MEKIIEKLGLAFDWLCAPTTISWMQEDGVGTISRFGFGFCVAVLLGIVIVCASPKLRSKFF